MSSITQRHHLGSTPRGAPWPQAWMSAKPLLRTAMVRACAGVDGRRTRGRRAGHAATARGLGAGPFHCEGMAAPMCEAAADFGENRG